MAGAQPMSTPAIVVDDALLSPLAVVPNEPDDLAKPGFAPGWAPGQGRQPEGDEAYEFADFTGDGVPSPLKAVGQPEHGTAPSNPQTGPYGPFQRWTLIEPIKNYPKSTHGKLFFSLNGGNFVCSATVIHRNTLITAGHCNSDGDGTFATNRLFCPSWKDGASSRGCWTVVNSKTSAGWHNNGDPDYDYACLVTSPTGTVNNRPVGNAVGWLGRSWNWPAAQAVRTFGYPQAAPFSGGRLQTTASTEWYSFHFTGGGQISKIIGSDLTGGSSGGSWILGFQQGSQEFPDTDGRSATDPGRNWVNGVNSHKRCRTTCQSPPTATNGVFWQEMSSPPFRRTNAGDESEDIVSVCFDVGGT